MNEAARPATRADDPIVQRVVLETVEDAGGLEEVASPRPLRLPMVTEAATLGNGWIFEVPKEGHWRRDAIEILAGRYIPRLSALLEGRKPRRVLDLGAGIGAFGLWAAIAWPRVWVDAWEGHDRLADVCKRNLPPGGKMLEARELIDLELGRYDVIRVGDLTAMASGNVLASDAIKIVDVVTR